jgi:hypothetical protein
VKALNSTLLKQVHKEQAHLKTIDQLLTQWLKVCTTVCKDGKCGVLAGLMALIEGEQNATVRLWVGDQSKSGSMVHRAESHGDHYHMNAKVPSKENAQTALWLEVQSVSGKTETGRIALQ